MAASWGDVRDVLVRVGFGSPRPAAAADRQEEEIPIESDTRAVTSSAGRTSAAAATSRSRPGEERRSGRRKRRTLSGEAAATAQSVAAGGVDRASGNDNDGGPDETSRTPSRLATSAAARRNNTTRRRGAKPLYVSPSQLALDLSPPPAPAAASVSAASGDGGTDLGKLSISPIKPPRQEFRSIHAEIEANLLAAQKSSQQAQQQQQQRRRDSSAAPSEYGASSDVDLTEVQDMVESIRRNLEHDLRQMSLSLDEHNGGAGAGASDRAGTSSGSAKDDGMVDHVDYGEQKPEERQAQDQERATVGASNETEAKDDDDGAVSSEDAGTAPSLVADGNDGTEDVGMNGREPQHLPTEGPVPTPIDFENYCPSRQSPHVASDEKKVNAVVIDADEPSKEGVKLPIPDPIGFESRSPPRQALMVVRKNDDALIESVDAKVNQSADKPEEVQTDLEDEFDKPDAYSPQKQPCCRCQCHDDDVDESLPATGPIVDLQISDSSPVVTLCQTAEAIKCRSEVSDVLSSIITDVELSNVLATDLRHRSETSKLRAELTSAQRALMEMHVVDQLESERRRALGDALVVELTRMGTELSVIQQLGDERDDAVREYADLQRQLTNSLDKIRRVEAERDDAVAAALRDRTLVEIEQMKQEAASNVEARPCAKSDEGWVALKDEAEPSHPPMTDEVKKDGDLTHRVTSTDFGIFIPEDAGSPGSDTVNEREAPSDEQDENESTSLLLLPERPLLVVFSFLEAEEILATAELNVIMYSRVDSLFGLGDMTDREEGGEISTNNVTEHSPTIVAVPPASDADEGAGPTGPSVTWPEDGLGTAFSKLLWQRRTLQRERSALAGIDASKTSSGGAGETALGGDTTDTTDTAGTDIKVRKDPSSHFLTAAVASKMASTLSPQELQVIISMRNKIIALEAELLKGQERQDDLMAELRGIEGVKDFLVTKLRDGEAAKRTRAEDEDRTARQVGSDQEVICFLDFKVMELEKSCERLQTEKDALVEEANSFRKHGNMRTEFLEDMLQLARDQSTTETKQWKKEKKLLVHEVKHCRHQIAALEAERQGMCLELSKLRKTVALGAQSTACSPKT